jgi:hypothetical protein
MGLFYLDAQREPRECPVKGHFHGRAPKDSAGREYCSRCSWEFMEHTNSVCPHDADCMTCHGTGRLGVEGARPDVEISHSGVPGDGFMYRIPTRSGQRFGPFPTESAALEAARAAHKADKSPR